MHLVSYKNQKHVSLIVSRIGPESATSNNNGTIEPIIDTIKST